MAKTTRVAPVCKLVITCNTIPKFNVQDQAVTARIDITPWRACFNDSDKAVYEPQIMEFKQDGVDGMDSDEEEAELLEAAPQSHLRDNDFVQRLSTDHLNDLFSYMVNAAIDYTRSRTIVRPELVVAETRKICKAQDSVQSFLDNECILDGDGATTPADLLEAYKKYTERNGMAQVSAEALKAALVTRNLKVKRRTIEGLKGPRQWIGLTLPDSIFRL
jgi:phage/plasmid-associated DNA primase